jgi:hypothetical protein
MSDRLESRKARLESWNARETILTWLGGFASLMCIFGGVFVLAGLTGLVSAESRTQPMLLLVLGTSMCVSAVGVWRVRPWARWAVLVIFAMLWLQSVLATLAGELSLGLLVFAVPVVYVLLPATGRRFAKAQGHRTAKAATPRAPGP